ncbi:hypothetical protein F5882DRAFT_446468 [Hyaloscypha sp. PMI_1271]|nr:hypothetical protein F5882DRAFT_446468 [Hyaloscypha sp. PMI_1271]
MSGRKAVAIERFGLTQVYAPEDESKSIAIIVFVHGLFGHPQRTWTGRKEPGQSIPSLVNPSSSDSRRLEELAGTGRSSVAADSETEPDVSNEISSREASAQGAGIPRPSLMGCSRIVGLHPGEVFWPESILPAVLPEARIFTWGYDADVDAFNTSVGHNTVEQHANDLLTDVANLSGRLGSLARPVVFVVHSLGGIVVKEALNIASHSEIERLKNLAAVTYGISFLGTPHRGSGSATIGKHAYRIARLATKRPNIKLLRSLEKNSDTLKGISNRFRSTQQRWDIKISSFYEDREVRKFFLFHSLIVDNESAQIGHPGEEVSSIPKNHREMTKFTSPEEVGFDRVSSQLRRWVNDISNNSQAYCLSSLENSHTRTRYINVATSYDGTLQWLFDRDIVPFVDWLEEDQNVPIPSRPVFWINGKPGSGKSTLMKFAMRDERTRDLLTTALRSCKNHPETMPEWIILGFFFHDRGSHIQKSIEGMLQGVLHQLLSQLPNLLPFVYTIYEELVKEQRKPNPIWTFDSLSAAWVAVTKQRKVSLSACIFLDALDEHEGDNHQLSKFIYELISSADWLMVRIKICVASRTWNVFGEHFGTCPQFAIHEYTSGDIQAYTSTRLSAPISSLGEETRLVLLPKIQRLSSQVTTKARGVFIWVRIVVDELVKGIRDGTAISLLEENVSKMPEELGDLYQHTLQRIDADYTQEAHIMLQIALCSLSPLPIEVFMKCVSFSSWGKVHEASEDEVARQLMSRSGGLLELVATELAHDSDSSHEVLDVESETYSLGTTFAVQFIHQTVKDFVAEKRNDVGLHLDPTFKAESGYLYLLESGVFFGRTWARELSNSIFEYAFLAELEGSTDGARLYKAFLPMLDTFPGMTLEAFAGWTLREWINLECPIPEIALYQPAYNTCLFLRSAVAADLKKLSSYILEMGYDGKDDYLSGAATLTMAATGRRLSTTSASREPMIKLLLKHGFYQNNQCRSSDAKDAQALRSRFDRDVLCTPLAWVLRCDPQKHISEEERYSIARLLLEHGADPNASAVPDACCSFMTSLLYSCVQHLDVEAVRLLLLHEADTSIIDHPLLFGLKMREETESARVTTMLRLLEGHGYRILWDPEIVHPATLLVIGSGFAAGIGSPTISSRVGRAHHRGVHRGVLS